MTRTPQIIYEELLAIDPSFKDHEATLLPVIEALLAQDPAREPDAQFIQDLKIRLREHAAALSLSPSPLLTMQRYIPYLSGAFAVLIIAPVVAFFLLRPGTFPVPAGKPLFEESIQSVAPGAFGTLPASAPSPAGQGDGVAMRPQSGGGGGGEIGANYAVDEKMIMPYPMVQYDYVYEGELPELSGTIAVYRRKPEGINVPLSAIGSRLNLGTINLESFRSMNMETITFQQNTDFGYQIFLNLRDATVSIDARWDKWPMSQCQTEECFQRERMMLDQIPEDSVIIDIAKAFAQEYGIDLTGYGEPQVDNLWRRDYERAENKEFAYVPDTQRVIFPVLMEGEPVYDQSGIVTGISMGVHVKHRRVMNVWGITGLSYEKSDYEGVTDASEIHAFLSRLDTYGMPEDKQIQKGTVTLGTPVLAFTVQYNYANNVSEELLVPSLIFPVEKVEGPESGGYFYRTSVVVPLAKDMLKEQTYPPVMPYMQKGIEEDAGAAGETQPVDEPAAVDAE